MRRSILASGINLFRFWLAGKFVLKELESCWGQAVHDRSSDCSHYGGGATVVSSHPYKPLFDALIDCLANRRLPREFVCKIDVWRADRLLDISAFAEGICL